MPGIPGTGGSLDGIAAEALTWLSLAAGTHTLIVNSDDGFQLAMGGIDPSDRENAVVVGFFNGGRGASDTVMEIQVPAAGLYATRLIWEEGAGGANVEFLEVLDDLSVVAINDAASTIRAYQAIIAVPEPEWIGSISAVASLIIGRLLRRRTSSTSTSGT